MKNKNILKNRLIANALITSPILSIYGGAPIVIFKVLQFENSYILFIGMTVNALIFWAINIFLYLRLTQLNKVFFYLLSFLLAFLSHLPKFFWVKPVLPFHNLIDKFILYPMIITLGINSIILIICNSIVLSFKKEESEREVSQLKLVNLEAQKQMLARQLHPHFLFNSLSILKSLIKESPNLAENYVVKLSDFLRYSVESHQTDLVSLKEELQFARDFIQLQKVRFDKAFTYSENIPHEILQEQIPVFALQALIENAFKHNYFTEKKPMHIQIAYDGAKIHVSNNKTSVRVTERSSTGLKNLHRRYELITGKGIEIENTADYFCVSIFTIKNENSNN